MRKIDKKYYQELKSWPFIEALKIIDRFGGIESFSNKVSRNFSK